MVQASSLPSQPNPAPVAASAGLMQKKGENRKIPFSLKIEGKKMTQNLFRDVLIGVKMSGG